MSDILNFVIPIHYPRFRVSASVEGRLNRQPKPIHYPRFWVSANPLAVLHDSPITFTGNFSECSQASPVGCIVSRNKNISCFASVIPNFVIPKEIYLIFSLMKPPVFGDFLFRAF